MSLSNVENNIKKVKVSPAASFLTFVAPCQFLVIIFVAFKMYQNSGDFLTCLIILTSSFGMMGLLFAVGSICESLAKMEVYKRHNLNDNEKESILKEIKFEDEGVTREQ